MRADAMESAYNILNTLDIRLMNAIDNMQKAREDIAFLKQHLKGWAEEQAKTVLPISCTLYQASSLLTLWSGIDYPNKTINNKSKSNHYG